MGHACYFDNTIIKVAQEYAGKVTVVKIDVSLNSRLSKLHATRGLPTLIVFKDGDEEIRKSDAITKSQLARLIDGKESL